MTAFWFLPNIQGSGNLRDLREAAELSPHLAHNLRTLADAGMMDRAEYMLWAEAITLGWIAAARPYTSSWEPANEMWLQEAA